MWTEDEIENELKRLIRAQGRFSPSEPLEVHTNLFNDLGFDSMDLIEIILAAETSFEITIEEEEFVESNIGYFFLLVCQKLREHQRLP